MSEFKLSDYFKDNRQELTREITTPQGLTMTVAYVHDDRFEAVKRQVEHIGNPKARELAARKALLKQLAGAVRSWDMSPEILGRYLPVDTSQLPQAIPCEEGVVSDLLNASDTFFGQVNLAVTDLAAFRVERELEERKN
jgi:hypothetical protein